MQNLKLSRKKPADIAFALATLEYDVVTRDEFFQWIYDVIEARESVPDYFFDLIDARADERSDLSKTTGVIAYVDGHPHNTDALIGIGFVRGTISKTDAVNEKTARKRMGERPEVVARFNTIFPKLAV